MTVMNRILIRKWSEEQVIDRNGGSVAISIFIFSIIATDLSVAVIYISYNQGKVIYKLIFN